MSAVPADEFSAAMDDSYPFLGQLMALRRRARELIGAGRDDVQAAVCRLLGEALLSEYARIARYRDHASQDAFIDELRVEFLRYATDEQSHAERLAERIVQLGGEPPASSAKRAEPEAERELDAEEVIDLLEEDLVAERIAIDSYREIMQYVGERDSITLELLRAILEVEVGHARDLAAIRTELMRRDRLSGNTSSRLPQIDLHYG